MKIQIGEEHVTITSDGGDTCVAGILEKITDKDGEVRSVLLDRVVHQSYWHDYTWDASGAVATELTRKQ